MTIYNASICWELIRVRIIIRVVEDVVCIICSVVGVFGWIWVGHVGERIRRVDLHVHGITEFISFSYFKISINLLQEAGNLVHVYIYLYKFIYFYIFKLIIYYSLSTYNTTVIPLKFTTWLLRMVTSSLYTEFHMEKTIIIPIKQNLSFTFNMVCFVLPLTG